VRRRVVRRARGSRVSRLRRRVLRSRRSGGMGRLAIRRRRSASQELHVGCSARTGDIHRRNTGEHERLRSDREAWIDMHPPPTSSRWLARSSAAGVLVAVSLVLGACGSSRSATILNTDRGRDRAEQLGSARSACPGELPFGCPPAEGPGVLLRSGPVTQQHTIRGTELEASGHVRYAARGGWSMHPSPRL
jgi:hypothetical protein